MSSRELLPGKITLAEKVISARLSDAKEIETEERIALKQALRTLRNLISESDRLQPENRRQSKSNA